eukprot:CAMPEP_0204374028 /NCGR_PEP_ID=MMETSP0469-20131031/48413_1 /ASSEMBLY_ACC=CAM_ASM_000384 /TAXON_ID=2969 /ORGANISM="Oxyrrhis marina" /LENGTH=707 /DNA_ID=CAMNT_0051364571 /DNA_START=10 /DNA_END=2130 /DNA_ORIENTATION=+
MEVSTASGGGLCVGVDRDPLPIDDFTSLSARTPRWSEALFARPLLWMWRLFRQGEQIVEEPVRFMTTQPGRFLPNERCAAHVVLLALPGSVHATSHGAQGHCWRFMLSELPSGVHKAGSLTIPACGGASVRLIVLSVSHDAGDVHIDSRVFLRAMDLNRALCSNPPAVVQAAVASAEAVATLPVIDSKVRIIACLQKLMCPPLDPAPFCGIGRFLVQLQSSRTVLEAPRPPGAELRRLLWARSLSCKPLTAKVPKLEMGGLLDDQVLLVGSSNRAAGAALPSFKRGRSEEKIALRQEIASEPPPTQLRAYRNLCSQIIEGIFLSGYAVATDRNKLAQHGISHVLNLAGDVCESRFDHELSYSTLFLKDCKEECISSVFHICFTCIERCLSGGGRILVHCKEGVSRSSTVVIAYLMWKLKVSFSAAHDMVVAARPIINPNAGFTCQLLLFERACFWLASATRQQFSRFSRVVAHDVRTSLLVHQEIDPGDPKTLIFDPRYVYVTYRGDQMAAWVGPDCPLRAAAVAAVLQERSDLEKFEGRSMTSASIDEKSQQPLSVWRLLFSPLQREGREPRVERQPAHDAEYLKLLQVAQRVTSTGQSETHSEPAPTSPQLTMARTSAMLFSHPAWDPIQLFDSDDLCEDQVFILHIPPVSCDLDGLIYVWAGTQQTLLSQIELQGVGEDFAEARGLRSVRIQVEYSGCESDAFF